MNAGMWGGKLPGGAALGRATCVHICKPCERMCAYLQTVRTNACIFANRTNECVHICSPAKRSAAGNGHNA